MQAGHFPLSAVLQPAHWRRAALWLFALLFVLQLAGAGLHKHVLSDNSGDCVSCLLASHVPAPAATPPGVGPLPPAMVAWLVPALPIYVYLASASYLIPVAQAPPASSLPL